MISAADESLWSAVLGRGSLLIDLGFVAILCMAHILSWVAINVSSLPDDKQGKAADGVRSAAAGGLTVVGILVPLTLLAIQLRTAGSGTASDPPASALVDFFAACVWLLISLTAGLYVLFVSATKGYNKNIMKHKDVGILFGVQLIFMFAGVFRLVWGIGSLISQLLSVS